MFNRTENFKQFTTMYPIVTALIAINVVLYVVVYFVPVIGDIVYNYGLQVNYLIGEGELWRLFTAMFLHGGFLHVLFNVFWLYLFGPEMESIAGKARFTTIYIVAGIVGNVATFFMYPINYASLGASGSIYGIFGAFAALVYYTRNTMPALKQMIIPLIVISVILTFLQPDVNATAHIGGLITGFVLGLVYLHPKRIISWRKDAKIRRVK